MPSWKIAKEENRARHFFLIVDKIVDHKGKIWLRNNYIILSLEALESSLITHDLLSAELRRCSLCHDTQRSLTWYCPCPASCYHLCWKRPTSQKSAAFTSGSPCNSALNLSNSRVLALRDLLTYTIIRCISTSVHFHMEKWKIRW